MNATPDNTRWAAALAEAREAGLVSALAVAMAGWLQRVQVRVQAQAQADADADVDVDAQAHAGLRERAPGHPLASAAAAQPEDPVGTTAPVSLLAAAVVLTELEARGHTCLPLDGLDEALDELWPRQGRQAAARAAWRGVLRRAWPGAGEHWPGSALVAVATGGADRAALLQGVSPLVLDAAGLAWRRAWRDEQRVAARLCALSMPPGATGAASRGADASAAVDEPREGRDASALGAAPPTPPQTRSPAAAPPVDAVLVDAVLDWLFPPDLGADQGTALQREAAVRLRQGRLLLLTGGPGTGKTWTAARMLVLQQVLADPARPLRVALAAPTGKAAARLGLALAQALAGLPDAPPALAAALPGLAQARAAAAAAPARTLHAWLGTRPGTRQFVHGPERPLAVDLMLVDEASMLHTELLAALLDALPPSAALVLLGDRDQLASVEAGAVMAELSRSQGVLAARRVELRAGRRFDGAIAQLATAVNAGDAQAAQAVLRQGCAVRERADASVAALVAASGHVDGYGPFLAALRAQPARADDGPAHVARVLAAFDGFRVLCALREGPHGVAGLNTRIVQALGFVPDAAGWFHGRPVMVTRNDATLGVFNGDVGVALVGPDTDRAAKDAPGAGAQAAPSLRVWFAAGGNLRSVAAARLPAVETAFAMTVHKSQGSEFGHVALVLPDTDTPVLNREWLYTGITRAREQLTLWRPSQTVWTAALARRTRRFSGLGAAIDAWGAA